MKIYVVTQGEYSCYRIITATADEELAKAIAKKFDQEWNRTNIEEFEDAEILLKPCWFVRFAMDGSVKECLCKTFNSCWYTDINQCKVDNAGGVVISVVAADSIAAIKIAAEKRAQYLAKKDGII